jgi:uncharacterized membrane protein YfcA
MNLPIAAALLVAVFFTSTLSGVFGMAGGLVLLGILLTILPVGTAIAVQGAIQIIANGSRAFFSREFIDWKILGIICLGLLVAGIVLFIIRYTPDSSSGFRNPGWRSMPASPITPSSVASWAAGSIWR